MLELKVGRGVGKGNEGEKTYLNGGVKMENSNEKIDILKRDEFINRVIQFVDNISEKKGNATFAINGEWGCGKTFVLEKIQEQLEHDKKFLVIPYNCWQYDYYNEPLVAIVAALIDFKDRMNKISEDTKKELKEIALNVGLGIATSVIKNKLGIDLGNFQVGVFKARDEIKNFDKYYNFKKSLSRLKQQLRILSEQYTIVFAVDELDRCLPEYAIKVLERLHHVSEGLSNMVTIIAVDKKRLENTVESIFGDKEQCAEKYLKKFIQFEMQLDNGEPDIIQFLKKFSDFSSRFEKSLYEIHVEDFLKNLLNDIEIRYQEQIVEKTSIIHDICFGNEKQDYTLMCMELFYSVLYYYYKTESIFECNHKVDNNGFSTIFEACADMEKFKSKANAFQSIKGLLMRTDEFHANRLYLNSQDIFHIVFYYWYNLPHQRSWEKLNKNELYPYLLERDKNMTLLNSNLEKLRTFLDSLKIVK